ncbi:MAG: hypothetical protein RSC38_06310, partial [Oscillospiraceae bacterium]
YATQQAIDNTDDAYKPSVADTCWWLSRTRDCLKGNIPAYASSISPSGRLSHTGCYRGNHGIRPLCNLSSSTFVYPSPNAQGQYELLF